MPFDPTQPFEIVEDSAPPVFDPSQPFEVVETETPQLSSIGHSSVSSVENPEKLNALGGVVGALVRGGKTTAQATDLQRAESLQALEPALAKARAERAAPGISPLRAMELDLEIKRRTAALDIAQPETAFPKVVERMAQRQRDIATIPQTEMQSAWEQANGWEAARLFATNPIAITANVIAQSLPASAKAMAQGVAGGILAGPPGVAAGMAAGSLETEYAAGILSALQSAGVDVGNPDALRGAFADKERMAAIKTEALKHGIPVAIFDGFSGGLAGKFLGPALGKGGKAVAVATGKEAMMQGAFGGGGEAYGQLATGKSNGKAIFEEMLAEVGSAGPATVINVRSERAKAAPAFDPTQPFEVVEEPPLDLSDLEAAIKGNQLKPASEATPGIPANPPAAREGIPSPPVTPQAAVPEELLDIIKRETAAAAYEAFKAQLPATETGVAKPPDSVTNVASEQGTITGSNARQGAEMPAALVPPPREAIADEATAKVAGISPGPDTPSGGAQIAPAITGTSANTSPKVSDSPELIRARNQLDALRQKGKGKSKQAYKLIARIGELERKQNKPAKPRGISMRARFHRETDTHGPDLLDWIQDTMPLLSKSAARRQNKASFAENKSQWDDAPESLAAPHHNVIYDEKGFSPNKVAQAAFEDGKISEPSEAALWAAIDKASKSRLGNAASRRREEAFLKEEARQQIAWHKATAKGETRVEAQQLKVGDLFEVDGEPIEVTGIDPDTGDVTLKDGRKFGKEIVLPEGEAIHVEKFEAAPEQEFVSVEEPVEQKAATSAEDEQPTTNIQQPTSKEAKPVERVAVLMTDYGKRRVEKRVGDKFDFENEDDIGFEIVTVEEITLEQATKINPDAKAGEVIVTNIDKRNGLTVGRVMEKPHADGTVTTEGIRSAQNILGISETKLQTIAKREQAAQANREQQTKAELEMLEKAAKPTPAEAAQDYRKINHSPFRTFEENDQHFRESVLLEKDGKFIRGGKSRAKLLQENGWKLVASDPAKPIPENVKQSSPAPFQMDAPESVEQQKERQAAEAAAAKKKADREELERRVAAPIVGTQGDIGQGDLLGEGDMFSAPAPKPSFLERADTKLAELEKNLRNTKFVGGTPFGIERTIAISAIRAMRLALDGGKRIMEAIQAAIDWVKRNQQTPFDETGFRETLEDELVGKELVRMEQLQEEIAVATPDNAAELTKQFNVVSRRIDDVPAETKERVFNTLVKEGRLRRKGGSQEPEIDLQGKAPKKSEEQQRTDRIAELEKAIAEAAANLASGETGNRFFSLADLEAGLDDMRAELKKLKGEESQGKAAALPHREGPVEAGELHAKVTEIGEKVQGLRQRQIALKAEGKDSEAAELNAELRRLRAQFEALQDDLLRAVPSVEEATAGQGPRDIDPVSRRVESATDGRSFDFKEWWEKIKRGFRYIGTSTPEVPIYGEKALRAVPFKEWERRITKATPEARREAEEAVRKVLEPLENLGRETVDPQANSRLMVLRNRIDDLNGRWVAMGGVGPAADAMQKKIDAAQAELGPLQNKLDENPFYLFRTAVLWSDLYYRARFLVNQYGNEVQLPGNVNVDTAWHNLVETNRKIKGNEHAGAITEAVKRHFDLMRRLQGEVLERGHFIPEAMRNPLYFPHHLLDHWTGRLDRATLSTEAAFRKYLITPTGSEKLIQTDYLKAIYNHVADVFTHNAQQDLTERFIKPFDISVKVQRELEAEAAEKGQIANPQAWRWEKNRPNGYVLFRPVDYLPLRLSMIVDRAKLAEAMQSTFSNGDLIPQLEQLGIDSKQAADKLIAALDTAMKETEWLIPEEIAAGIRGLARLEEQKRNPSLAQELLQATAGRVTTAWKKIVLYAPYNYPRYEFGNTMTDIIKLATTDQKIFTKLPQAYREVIANARGEEATADFRKARELGVLQTVTAAEAGTLQKMPGFETFQNDVERLRRRVAQGASDVTSLGLPRLLTGNTALSLPELSNFRESVFRYAKYLADMERQRAGKKPNVGGAPHDEVDMLETPEEKAAFIANRFFGDYADISYLGKMLRQYAIPFWSWQEINLRYNANLARNAFDAMRKRQTPEAAMRTANWTAHSAAIVLVNLALFHAGLMLWNRVGGVLAGLWDEDDDLEGTLSAQDRRRAHLVLGKDAKGQTRVAYVPNATSDALEWIGGNNFARLAAEYYDGKITLQQFTRDYAKQLPKETANKLGQSTGPVGKAAYMLTSGQNPFPDIFNQRKIAKADFWWVLAQSVSDRTAVNSLRALFDKEYYSPQDIEEWAQQSVLQVRRRDPEQWAYYEIRDKANDWLWDTHGKKYDASSDNKDQQVIRNFRKAIYRADLPNAIRFYNVLVAPKSEGGYGYTSTRFKASIANQDPLSVLNKEEAKEFKASLSKSDRELLTRAYIFYQRMASAKDDATALFPKNVKRSFTPDTNRLQRVISGALRMTPAEERKAAERLMGR